MSVENALKLLGVSEGTSFDEIVRAKNAIIAACEDDQEAISQGENGIALVPWDEWWEFELNKDDANPHIALLPLHPDVRAKFNETAAWEYALSMNGKPYGYHNVIFSWIDTIDGNYTLPLDAHLVASVMTVWNQIQPQFAANLWNEACGMKR